MRRIIFDDDYYRAIFTPVESERVIVLFSKFDSALDSTGGDFTSRLESSSVYVVSKLKDWWQSPSRDKVAEAIRRVIAPYKHRVSYGLSMGAYGALSLGAAMDCTKIVALSPQTVISNPSVPLFTPWAEAISLRPIMRDDIPSDLGDVVPDIVFDPAVPVDNGQVAYLRARHAIRELPLVFAGHRLMATLKECGILDDVTRSILTSGANDPTIRSWYRQRRHTSRSYLTNAAAFCAKKAHFDLAARYLDHADRLGDPAARAAIEGLIKKGRAHLAAQRAVSR